MELKFGALPEDVRAKVAAADAERLLLWGKRLLRAKTLEQVFDAHA